MTRSIILLLATLSFAEINDPVSLYGVCFVNAKTGFLVGNQGAIYRTDDGGRQWLKLTVPVQAVWQRCYFINEKEGWVAGGQERYLNTGGVGVVLHTRDGGQNWEVSYPPQAGWLLDIRFIDKNRGYVCGQANNQYDNALFETRDGGKSWTWIKTGQQGWLYGIAVLKNSGRLVCGSEDGRVVLVQPGKEETTVATQPLPPGSSRFSTVRSLYFTDEKQGCAVGDNAYIVCTKDGGRTWTRSDPGLPAALHYDMDLRQVVFVDPQRGFAVGGIGSIILATDDGGKRWKPVPLPRKAWLWGLGFVDRKHGWAVGDMGTVLHTSDGGKSWEDLSLAEETLDLLYVVPHHDDDAGSAAGAGFWTFVQKYRTGVCFTARDDRRDLYYYGEPSVLESRYAVNVFGASPVRTYDELINSEGAFEEAAAEWEKELGTDGLRVMTRLLTAAIRTYRPKVVVTHEPIYGDYNKAEHKLCGRAASAAFACAGQADSFPELLIAGLAPFQPERLYYRTRPRLSGRPRNGEHAPHLKQETDLFVPALKTTLNPLMNGCWLRYKSKHVGATTGRREYYHLKYCLDQDFRQTLLPLKHDIPDSDADSDYSKIYDLPEAEIPQRLEEYLYSHDRSPYAHEIGHSLLARHLAQKKPMEQRLLGLYRRSEPDTGLGCLMQNEIISLQTKQARFTEAEEQWDNLFAYAGPRAEFAPRSWILGNWFFNCGLFEKAEQNLSAAVADNRWPPPYLAEATAKLGIVRRLAGDTAGAAAWFVKSARTGTDNVWSKIARSELFLLTGQGKLEKKQAPAKKTINAVTIDGKMDEVDWRKSTAIPIEIPQRQFRFSRPWQRSEVRLMHDHDKLYFHLTVHEDRMDLCLKDPKKYLEKDLVTLGFDPQRNYLKKNELCFKPATLTYQGFGGLSKIADSAVQVKIILEKDSWNVEAAVSLKSLGIAGQEKVMGFNVFRERTADLGGLPNVSATTQWLVWEMPQPHPSQDLVCLYGYLVLEE